MLAVLVGAGVAMGGGAAALASTDGGGPKRQAARACVAEAKAADPGAERAELREAVRACLEADGFRPGRRRAPDPERQARRQALRACLQEERSANPDAGRDVLGPLVRECLRNR